jgi:hypothetical protein
MLKTNTEQIANPSIGIILYGQLKGYIRRPLAALFLIILSIGPISRKIPHKFPADLRKVCALMTAMYKLFLKKMEKEKALALTKALAIPIALSVQIANFRYVESDRTFSDLIKYQKRTNSEGPTRMNKMKILEENNENYIFQIQERCCFFDIFTGLGTPELTTIFCETDNAIFNVYNADKITFERGGTEKRIVDGAKVCTFNCRNNSIQPTMPRTENAL